MFEPLRPFERDTLPKIFFHAVERFRGADALRSKERALWRSWSHQEVERLVLQLAARLQEAGVAAGDRVALLSENRPEWAITDYATLALGAITVPIYPTLPADQVAGILEDSGARIAFGSTAEQMQKLLYSREQYGRLEHVVVFDGLSAAAGSGVEPFSAWVAAASDLSADRARQLRAAALAVAPEATATLIYTSGTTGAPKGVMLSHRNLAAMVAATQQSGSLPAQPGEVALSILPLSHVLERAADYCFWDQGVTIAYAESMEKVAENLREIRPHAVVAVPRLFEKIYGRAVGSATGLKGVLVHWATRVGGAAVQAQLHGQPEPRGVGWQYAWAKRLVFRKLRRATGKRLHTFISGGAPLPIEVGEFFFAAGLRIHEGYGLTESSPVLAANRPGTTRLGTVGLPFPGIELKIGHDGEILARGPTIMQGYWNNPEATAQAVDAEGWLHTGDIGEFTSEGMLRITDRLKDLIVTAGGKNIAPQPIETHVALSPYVAQAVMFGDRRPYPVLLVAPDWEALRPWAEEHRVDLSDRARAAQDPQLRELLERESLGRLLLFARHERPKKLAIILEELSIENGLLTPSLKVKRRVAAERFQPIIAALYEDGGR